MAPQIIFGTATFGMTESEIQEQDNVASVLKILQENGVKRLDTAARYPPLNPGRSEELIGECSSESSNLAVDTKVYTDTKTDGSGDLTRDAIRKSVDNSLTRLQRTSEGVNILHIHRADPSTPISEQVRAFNEQITQGHCKAWGISNVPLEMCEEIFRVCDAEGLQKPVCYQGEYNVMTRGAETALLQLLRANGVAFNAFRPLASGFLTGKFIKGSHAGTRFGDNNPLGKLMQSLFGNETLHEAAKKFDTAVIAHDMTTVEVAIRWIFYHSALGDADGVILGASKESQLQETLNMIHRGPLPPGLLDATEDLWNAVKESRGGIF